jgi:hypothetical protein
MFILPGDDPIEHSDWGKESEGVRDAFDKQQGGK